MPRTATIGPAVYERVTQLTAEGKNRTEAFEVVAAERSMNPGTVSANYYRVARSQGSKKPRKARAKTSARRAATSTGRARGRAARTPTSAPASSGANGDISALANQIGDLVQQLVRQVDDRDRRMRELLG